MENQLQNKSPDDILQNKLDETEQLGKYMAEQGREITASGQKLIDLAQAIRQVSKIKYMDPAKNNFIEDFHDLNRGTNNALVQLEKAQVAPTVSSLISSVYVNSTGSVQQFSNTQYLSVEEQSMASDAINNLFNIVSLPTSRQEVLDILDSLHLDIAPKGTKKPSEQINIAFSAYEHPISNTNPVSTSLIPMRESIETIIAELLCRRPKQEKSGNDYQKIVSIGMQLCKNEVEEHLIHTWAFHFVTITKELSGAKQKDLSREEWTHILLRAISFLEGFLNGLDPSKFKK